MAMVMAGLSLALLGCGTTWVSPSTYAGSPESPDIVLMVEAGAADEIAEAKVTGQDDEQVVVEVRLTRGEPDENAAGHTLEATVRLDGPLGGRQVVDQEGRAIPQA